MNKKRQKWIDYTTLIITLVISLTIIAKNSRQNEALAVHVWALEMTGVMLKPFQNFQGLLNVRKENQRLIQKNIQLQLENANLVEERLENRRLREMMNLQQNISNNTIPARVIGLEGMAGVQSLILDKGKNAGIQPNMPVISLQGLVGKIIQASANHSIVQAVTDKNFRSAARTREGRVTGLFRGNGSHDAQLWGVPLHESVKTGEIVTTSGLYSIFPEGIHLGTVVDVSDDPLGLFYAIRVAPFEHYQKVEFVLVVDISKSDEQ